MIRTALASALAVALAVASAAAQPALPDPLATAREARARIAAVLADVDAGIRAWEAQRSAGEASREEAEQIATLRARRDDLAASLRRIDGALEQLGSGAQR